MAKNTTRFRPMIFYRPTKPFCRAMQQIQWFRPMLFYRPTKHIASKDTGVLKV